MNIEVKARRLPNMGSGEEVMSEYRSAVHNTGVLQGLSACLRVLFSVADNV